MNNFDNILAGPTIDVASGIPFVFKLFIFVILAAYVFYAFLLMIRVRILADTAQVGPYKLVRTLAFLHLVGALIGSFLAFIVAILA
ncbi:MAG: hypothetical protein Fur003_4240 [Candidatus Dojkabacteria bacterium]